MKYRGHLLLPGDDGPGLAVHLDLAEHHMAVESDGGTLGAWPLEAVGVGRLEGDVFALTVAGEDLRFVADDSIAFTYSGIPTIEGVSRRLRTRTTFRSFMDRLWSTQDPSADVEKAEEKREEVETLPLPPAHTAGRVEASSPDLTQDRDSLVDAPTTATEEPPHGSSTSGPVEAGAAGSSPLDEVSHTRCPAVRNDGRQCESPILTTTGYCYPHDPKRAFDDKYRAAQKARDRIKYEATGRLNRIYGRLDKAMRQVERGELDPEIAMAMAQLARTMCAILDVDTAPSSAGSGGQNP